MNIRILKFLLHGAMFFMAGMPEEKAKQLVKSWRMKQSEFLGDDDTTWSVRSSDVIAIHPVDPRELQGGGVIQQGAMKQVPGFPNNLSGLN